MIKIGLLLENLSASQIAFCAAHQASVIQQARFPQVSVTLFYEELALPYTPCLCMQAQIVDAHGFSGHLVATTLSTARKALRAIRAEPTLTFYVWDLEWVRGNPSKPWTFYDEVYTDPRLRLVARSESHKEVLEKSFKIPHPVLVAEDFDLLTKGVWPWTGRL